jgi:hypothetical protein
MIIDGLPKSYIVKQRRGQLNDISNVVSTPGNANGPKISFTDMLKNLSNYMMKWIGVKENSNKTLW